MARDGSGVYSKPANTTAVTGQTITASLWNTMIDDLVADANLDRPIAAGGTGASSASGARSNLGVPAVSENTTITATYTFSNNFPLVRFLETDQTGAGAMHSIALEGKIFTVQSRTEAGEFVDNIARFDARGTNLTNSESVITREKGDARYSRINTKTSATETNFDIGTTLLAIVENGQPTPALNSIQPVRLNTGFYFVNGSTGTLLAGLWRVCGLGTVQEFVGVNVMIQRVPE